MAVFDKDATGGQQWVKQLPIESASANLKAGAFVKWGPTDGTDRGFIIPCPVNTALSGLFVGILEQAWAGATLDNAATLGTTYLKAGVTINPHAIYRAQIDNTFGSNALAVTGVGATTVVTSGENIGNGWLMFDNYELHYVLSCSSGTYTTKSSTSSAITTSSKVAKLYYPSCAKVPLTADYTQIATNVAAAAAVEISVLELFIKAVGFDWVELDPTKHDNIILPGSSTVNTPAVWATVQSTQHFLMNK